MRRVVLLSIVVLGAMACAHKPAAPQPASSVSKTTKAVGPASPNIAVSDDIATICQITVDNIERAPKFDYDKSELLPEDKSVLQQVATCFTTGPLKGHAMRLIGRTDPRGESEYNMTLGSHRAGNAGSYLSQLGVDQKRIAQTSRGELDSSGNDEEGWRRDRRVDILLQVQ